jgi:aspartate dehydrogenase
MDVVLIGFGAIGQAICKRLQGSAVISVSHVVVRAAGVEEAEKAIKKIAPHAVPHVRAVTQVPLGATLCLECAGHEALGTHVMEALRRGVECAVLSTGALAEPGLPERLSDAALQGGTQVHLLSGAIGGMDALAAARLSGLDEVTYTGRKPPASWSPAPASLREITVILQATAREAARLYPKNANVAATIALAGLGLDKTQVRLVSDPSVTTNVHEIHAKGAFGEMKFEIHGKPLDDNPKTSALTVLSALRFLHNRASSLAI